MNLKTKTQPQTNTHKHNKNAHDGLPIGSQPTPSTKRSSGSHQRLFVSFNLWKGKKDQKHCLYSHLWLSLVTQTFNDFRKCLYVSSWKTFLFHSLLSEMWKLCHHGEYVSPTFTLSSNHCLPLSKLIFISPKKIIFQCYDCECIV